MEVENDEDDVMCSESFPDSGYNESMSCNNITSTFPSPMSSKPSSSTAPPQSLMSPLTPAPCGGDPGLMPVVQNIVATVNLCCTLDLKKINFHTRNSEYNPARFCGVIMRLREPHTTALVFHSGKVVITGAKSEDAAHLAARKFARIIQKLGFNVRFRDFKIQNIVATFDTRFPIRVDNLHQMHGQFSRYEPEIFPALIYRLVKPRVVLLIFVNGKLVMTGAKCRGDLHGAFSNMYPILKSFRKQ